ncbi:ASCH domain-containing protein [Nocardioides insulae]|uniref:ASCH domain-containing protein n=1 Tax=Nocardioides insulae TaxID=394734 RepID=UPI00040F9262|nr:ASCH domain-containing protein [Nocardioides insulae]
MSVENGQVGPEETEISAFWEVAKRHAQLGDLPGYFGASPLEALQPPAWAFGGTPEQADGLLDLVLEGTKTGTASALWDYEVTGEPVPEEGALSIVLDGRGHPRALLVSHDVRVVPFDEVDEEHAYAEGEGDRSLAQWREVHERFFTTYADHDRGFSPDMPVVVERFKVVYKN